MRKQVSDEKRCPTCNNITKYSEHVEVCDNCGVDIEWDAIHGYPYRVQLYHHHEECPCGEIIPSFNFCSKDCGAEWLVNKADQEFKKHKIDDDYAHVEFSISPDKLQGFIHSLTSKARIQE